MKTLRSTFFLIVLGITAFAQDSAYYDAIQKRSGAPVSPSQFKQLEETAMKEYARADSYETLATRFGDSTEKVWAVIYGEIFCNLTSDEKRSGEVGALVFTWHDQALTKNSDGLSINLTENAQAPKKGAPFEANFEVSVLLGAVNLRYDVKPLSIATMVRMRRSQLGLWQQKGFKDTGLMKWQRSILSAGHFEAYHYWLFRKARPDESRAWVETYQPEWQQWLEWRSKNQFKVIAPDSQRLYLLRN